LPMAQPRFEPSTSPVHVLSPTNETCLSRSCSSCDAVQVPSFSGFQKLLCRHLVGLLGRRIGSSQALYLHSSSTEKGNGGIHACPVWKSLCCGRPGFRSRTVLFSSIFSKPIWPLRVISRYTNSHLSSYRGTSFARRPSV
jgi:hypothetical protein